MKGSALLVDMLPKGQRVPPLLPLVRNESHRSSVGEDPGIQTESMVEVAAMEKPLAEVPAIELREMQANEISVSEMQAAKPSSVQALPVVEMPAAQMTAWELAAAPQTPSARCS